MIRKIDREKLGRMELGQDLVTYRELGRCHCKGKAGRTAPEVFKRVFQSISY